MCMSTLLTCQIRFGTGASRLLLCAKSLARAGCGRSHTSAARLACTVLLLVLLGSGEALAAAGPQAVCAALPPASSAAACAPLATYPKGAASREATAALLAAAATLTFALGVLTTHGAATRCALRRTAAADAAALAVLQAALFTAPGEAAVLTIGLAALRALFPFATAAAVGGLCAGEAGSGTGNGPVLVTACSVLALFASAEQLAPLRIALTSPASSAARAAAASPGVLLDSASLGGAAFPDWAALRPRSGAAACGRSITAAITAAGGKSGVVGFALLYHGQVPAGVKQPKPPRWVARASPLPGREAKLMAELCATLGGALLLLQADALVAEGIAAGLAACGVATVARGSASSAAEEEGDWAALVARPPAHSSLRRRGCTAQGASPADTIAFPSALLVSCDDDAGGGWGEADVAWLRVGSALGSPHPHPADRHRLLAAMLGSLGLDALFGVPPAAFASLTRQVEAGMPSSGRPFHCFEHAFNVAHAAWRMLDGGRLLEEGSGPLHPLDGLVLLLSALCHDLEHTGRTNAFEIATRSPLALLYNDHSVLENHHASTGFALLTSTGVLAGLSADKAKLFRPLFITAVLATDMAQHARLLADAAACWPLPVLEPPSACLPLSLTPSSVVARVSAVAAACATATSPPRSLDERALLISLLLHSADLSSPLMPVPSSRRVTGLLDLEYAAQAEVEAALGLPASVPVAFDSVAKAQMELSFLRFVVLPLYCCLAELLPQLAPLLASIADNVAAWEAVESRAKTVQTR